MPNRLANETSPYLLQHKDNPVDWYPWGEEAFEKARSEDLPIFLSVGYSACHWCHVMERESFEDEAVAALLNERYVSIKVDREERPDVDAIYMSTVQAMTGSGGWPMSVFLTPDAKPFFSGTYFPPEDRGEMPSFTRVLQSLANGYQSRKAEIVSTASDVVEHLAAYNEPHANDVAVSRSLFTDGIESFKETFDPENGGFGVSPKFPQPLLYEFLLRAWADTGDSEILKMVETTLTRMARGGIYDQIGGGFHRYSVDSVWLVPHFEKMLYDNALLAPLFLHTYQATRNTFFKDIAQDILAYVEREMLHADGAFYSAQDADSEGEEGKFFTWTAAEFALPLGEKLGITAATYWAASTEGNFEGKNILWMPRADDVVATELGLTIAELQESISQSRDLLFAAREKRVKPALDNKVLTSWNALMQKAFAEAGAILGRKDYVEIALRNAEFLETRLESDGRVLRTWKDDPDADPNMLAARLKGYLEDYAFQIDALISLHQATFDPRWLRRATALTNSMIDLFWDEESGVFYDTGVDHEDLLIRPRNVFDNAQPSGSSVAVMSLLKMSVITGDDLYRTMAESAMNAVSDIMRQAPGGLPVWMSALDFQSSTPVELAVFGDPDSPPTRELLDVIHAKFLPNKVILGTRVASTDPISPLLEGRGLIDGKPTVYVCENYACQLPATDSQVLAGQLDR